MKRVQKTRQTTQRAEVPAESQEKQIDAEAVSDDLTDLMDEIDSILGENQEILVNFRQQGGQ